MTSSFPSSPWNSREDMVGDFLVDMAMQDGQTFAQGMQKMNIDITILSPSCGT